MDLNNAAINTFTGQQAVARGFTEVRVIPGGQFPAGTYYDVTVEFSKPPAPLQVTVPATTNTSFTVPFPVWVPGNKK